jgi:microcystin-dependent protein
MLKIGRAAGTLAFAVVALVATLDCRRAAAQADPLLGQLVAVGFNFCPRGWAPADGQLLPIAQNTALFSLLGTTYGGDGRTTFALPDLRGRVAISRGRGTGLSDYVQGQRAGAESFTMTQSQLPTHTHTATTTSTVRANDQEGNQNAPANHVLANDGNDRIYSDQAPNVSLNAAAVSSTTQVNNTGGGQAVQHRGPFLTVLWCIALQGIFPSRN